MRENAVLFDGKFFPRFFQVPVALRSSPFVFRPPKAMPKIDCRMTNEARKGNAEARSSNDERSPKSEIRNTFPFDIRPSFVIRASSFVIFSLPSPLSSGHFPLNRRLCLVRRHVPLFPFRPLLLELKQPVFQAFSTFSKGYLCGFQAVFASVINRGLEKGRFSRRKQGCSLRLFADPLLYCCNDE
jgi:hypothetical protein